jgi:hypothetical protein
MKDTHPQVKFDVFERLNTGAVKLSAQELRHGIYHGKLIDWLDHSGRDRKWRELIASKSDKRMKAEEFILRFLAMHFELDQYEKPLAGFLNEFAERNRDASEQQLATFSSVLAKTVAGVEALFGRLAFKVFDPRDRKRIISDFNAALFDAEMLAVSRCSVDLIAVPEEVRTRILDSVSQLFQNEGFQRSITLATSDAAQIRTRVRMMEEVLAALV